MKALLLLAELLKVSITGQAVVHVDGQTLSRVYAPTQCETLGSELPPSIEGGRGKFGQRGGSIEVVQLNGVWHACGECGVEIESTHGVMTAVRGRLCGPPHIRFIIEPARPPRTLESKQLVDQLQRLDFNGMVQLTNKGVFVQGQQLDRDDGALRVMRAWLADATPLPSPVQKSVNFHAAAIDFVIRDDQVLLTLGEKNARLYMGERFVTLCTRRAIYLALIHWLWLAREKDRETRQAVDAKDDPSTLFDEAARCASRGASR